MNDKEQILALRKQLNEHNYKYYVLNEPDITDFEFDALMRQLQQLEAQHPDMADPNSPTQLPWLAVAVLVPLLLAFTLVKRLDIMLLGYAYAQSLGVSVPRVRRMVLLLTGFLTAVTTAFCGPIAFIGLAVPHLARMAVRTDAHLCLMPASLLMGALVAVLCQIGCSVPGAGGVLPINAVTPLVGAPVVLYVILHDKK